MAEGRYLIINADDLGWLAGRDRGIFRSIEYGIVTSVSLFANGATFAAAAAELSRYSVGVGVHLNLSEGGALTGTIRGLTDCGGNFLGKSAARQIFLHGDFDRDAALRELRAQVQRVLDSGVVIDHIDSHQHMFIFPAMSEIMLDICEFFSITAVRLPLPAEPRGDDPLPPLGDELQLYRQHAGKLATLICANGLFAPAGLWGMPHLNRLDEAVLLAMLEHIPAGCWELMVHPGDEDAGMVFCGVERRLEQQALVAASVHAAIKKHAITLTTFGEQQ